jgi:hypothetical protein
LGTIANLDGKSFALRGPMRIADPRHTPVRGDLADIRLDADTLETLADGATFGVLDISGGWAWGQANGERGLVGYVALDQLEALT